MPTVPGLQAVHMVSEILVAPANEQPKIKAVIGFIEIKEPKL
jgi:hypothetical protein